MISQTSSLNPVHNDLSIVGTNLTILHLMGMLRLQMPIRILRHSGGSSSRMSRMLL